MEVMAATEYTTIEEKELLELARKRVKKIKNFYIHLFIYAIGVTVFVLKTYFGVPFNFIPVRYINWFVMWIWTFFFVVQAVQLFFSEVIFGKKWEQKKIQNFIKKDANKQTWE